MITKILAFGNVILLVGLIASTAYLKIENTELEKIIIEKDAAIATLNLSVESMSKQRQLDDDYISTIGNDLQACIDSKNSVVQQFNYISKKYREASTEPVTGEVINESYRQELRNDLQRPLPFPSNSVQLAD